MPPATAIATPDSPGKNAPWTLLKTLSGVPNALKKLFNRNIHWGHLHRWIPNAVFAPDSEKLAPGNLSFPGKSNFFFSPKNKTSHSNHENLKRYQQFYRTPVFHIFTLNLDFGPFGTPGQTPAPSAKKRDEKNEPQIITPEELAGIANMLDNNGLILTEHLEKNPFTRRSAAFTNTILAKTHAPLLKITEYGAIKLDENGKNSPACSMGGKVSSTPGNKTNTKACSRSFARSPGTTSPNGRSRPSPWKPRPACWPRTSPRA